MSIEDYINEKDKKNKAKEAKRKDKEKKRQYQASFSDRSQLETNNVMHVQSKSDYAAMARKKNKEAKPCIGCERIKKDTAYISNVGVI